jgi:hypothetical protein
MPTLKVNEIISYSGNTLSLGTSGDTVTVPANVTFNALSGNVYIPNGIIKLDSITTSATATYNLTYGGSAYSPASATACLVSVNGVLQTPGTAFTISGSQITFSSALNPTDVINFIIVLAAPYTINAPGDGTVGFNQITSNLITGATAETSIAGGDSILIYDDSATALRKMTRTNFVSGLANTPAFSAYQSTAQTITSATFTKMNFQTEELDSDNNFASSRFTPTTSGYYFFTVNFSVASSATNGLVAFYKNGTEFKKSAYLVVSSVNQFNASSGLINLNGSTDYIEAYIYLATGQNLTGASTATWFTGFRVTGI